jgi:hypothetical protein
MRTAKVVSKLPDARNTLTQRMFAYYSRILPTPAVVKMEVDSMREGDIAGLAVFQDPYAYIAVKQDDDSKYIIMVDNGKTIDSVATESSTFYLRTLAYFGTSKASFAYSFDNELFTSLGDTLSMRFRLTVFTGNKFCLFNYATQGTGGFVDFDWFRTTTAAPIH